MPSTVVALLAERPGAELRQMQSRLEAEGARLEKERVRIEVELAQIRDALARQARRTGGRSIHLGTSPMRRGAAGERILEAVAHFEHPVSPAQIIAELESHGATPSRGSIHNSIGRLVRNGLLTRLGEGQYQLASRNGSSSEPNTGPTENEATEPLLTATEPQEVLTE